MERRGFQRIDFPERMEKFVFLEVGNYNPGKIYNIYFNSRRTGEDGLTLTFGFSFKKKNSQIPL